MKVRTQRTHFMGSSNRAKELNFAKTRDVHQNSYIKSQSCYYKTTSNANEEDNKKSQNVTELSKTKNPFNGMHHEHETQRFDKNNVKKFKPFQNVLAALVPNLDFKDKVNEQLKEMKQKYEGRDINMHKLNQLKHTFIKNNAKRRFLKEYFIKHSKGNAKIGVQELKNLVKQYGYDINEDEAQLIFQLTTHKSNNQDGLDMANFVELMTKDNVYFRTLKIRQDQHLIRTQKLTEKVHLILRNKFISLKEAFNIYTSRQEIVDYDKFNFVMKKLDINDLIMTKQERMNVYELFQNQQNQLNVEALLCSIVDQESRKKATYPQKLSDFDDNLKYVEEINSKKMYKPTDVDFKHMTNFQYEQQLHKAEEVVAEIRKINQKRSIIEEVCSKKISKIELRDKIQRILQSEGINFNKQSYDCFSAYLDYNDKGFIPKNHLKRLLLEESSKEAQQRFQRRVRAPPPEPVDNEDRHHDLKTAIQTLKKIKSINFTTDMKSVFKSFDKDHDGYVSREEFKKELNKLKTLEPWEIQNLANYFDSDAKGYIQFKDFTNKYSQQSWEGEPPQQEVNTSIKLKSHSEWLSSKRNFIKQNNSSKFNVPTKYSAWPDRLYEHDLSMIQAPKKSGLFINETDRFNHSEKHSLAQEFKIQKNRIYENKLRKLSIWNEVNQERTNEKSMKEEERHLANNYSLRLTKEQYLANLELK